jgi:tRNA-Thr(GGU) m(6)t(6)A37 methyltransferase TsaA
MPDDTPIRYCSIGLLETPFTDIAAMPIQPPGARGVRGILRIKDEYAAGLRDLDGFSHCICLYHLHRCSGFALEVTPFLDRETHGIFATRSPKRPNPIGLSVLRIVAISGNTVELEDVDMLNGTPVLDLKPYVPAFDAPAADRFGWLTEAAERADVTKSDGRFG